MIHPGKPGLRIPEPPLAYGIEEVAAVAVFLHNEQLPVQKLLPRTLKEWNKRV